MLDRQIAFEEAREWLTRPSIWLPSQTEIGESFDQISRKRLHMPGTSEVAVRYENIQIQLAEEAIKKPWGARDKAELGEMVSSSVMPDRWGACRGWITCSRSQASSKGNDTGARLYFTLVPACEAVLNKCEESVKACRSGSEGWLTDETVKDAADWDLLPDAGDASLRLLLNRADIQVSSGDLQDDVESAKSLEADSIGTEEADASCTSGAAQSEEHTKKRKLLSLSRLMHRLNPSKSS